MPEKTLKGILKAESLTPVEVAEIGEYKWPYTNISLYIKGIAWEAKSFGREIVCINVAYMGIFTKDGTQCHKAIITAYTREGLCGHEDVGDCIEQLEKYKIGPCYPLYDFHSSWIRKIVENRTLSKLGRSTA